MSLARDIADLGSVTTRLDTLGASNRNIIINGGQTVDQRNSAIANGCIARSDSQD